MSTITVRHRYVVRPEDNLSFTDEPALLLKPGSHQTEVSLVDAGQVTVVDDRDKSSIIGIDSVISPATAEVVIQASGSLSVTAQGSRSDATALALHMDGAVTNKGEVHVSAVRGEAIGWFSDAATVDIRNAGLLKVDGQVAYAAMLMGAATVENTGAIVSTGHAFGSGAIGVEMHGGGILSNSGSIDVKARGSVVGVDFSSTYQHVDNSGSVVVHTNSSDELAYALRFSGEADVAINNTGQIKAINANGEHFAVIVGFADDAEGPNVTISNPGKIVGDLLLGGGQTVVHDAGQIVGNVFFGRGDDLLDVNGDGRITGAVNGGGGDDSLLGGAGADDLRGEGIGYDPLGAAGDDLLSGAGGDDTLDGSIGADTLIGGTGRDLMTGGHGVDTFRFDAVQDSRVDQPDLITDLESRDKVDLSNIDADANTAGDQRFTLVSHLDGHSGEAALTYDASAGMTHLALDVTGDGVADAQIDLAGDQTSFTRFIL